MSARASGPASTSGRRATRRRSATSRLPTSERTGRRPPARGHCAEGRIDLDEFSDRRRPGLRRPHHRSSWSSVLADLPEPIPAAVADGRGRGAARQPTSWIVGHHVGGGRARAAGGRRRDQRRRGHGRRRPRPARRRDRPATRSSTAPRSPIMGGIDIIVPEGIEVELSGVADHGRQATTGVKDVTPLPGTPIVQRARASRSGAASPCARSRASGSASGRRATAQRPRRARRRAAMRDASVHERCTAERAIQRPRGAASVRPPRSAADGRPEPSLRRASTRRIEADAAVRRPRAPSPCSFSDIEGFTGMTERARRPPRPRTCCNKHNDIVRRARGRDRGGSSR